MIREKIEKFTKKLNDLTQDIANEASDQWYDLIKKHYIINGEIVYGRIAEKFDRTLQEKINAMFELAKQIEELEKVQNGGGAISWLKKLSGKKDKTDEEIEKEIAELEVEEEELKELEIHQKDIDEIKNIQIKIFKHKISIESTKNAFEYHIKATKINASDEIIIETQSDNIVKNKKDIDEIKNNANFDDDNVKKDLNKQKEEEDKRKIEMQKDIQTLNKNIDNNKIEFDKKLKLYHTYKYKEIKDFLIY